MSKLYHKDVFWNNKFENESKKLVNSVKCLSFHLKEHLNNPDKKHTYKVSDIWNCLNKIKQNKGYLFEVETENEKVVKSVYRVALNNEYDLCLVIRYSKIVTAWLNKNNDKHITLNTTKYERG